MIKSEWSMILGLVVALVIGPQAAFAQTCENLSQNVLRLHIVANSDTPADQALKLQVRDAILALEPFGKALTLEEAVALAEEQLPQIQQVAHQVLAQANVTDSVAVEITRMYFPTRHYDGFDLPAGEYTALRITIGQAVGQNWFCLVYPPLCVPAAQPPTTAQMALEKQLFALSDTPVYEARLLLWEKWQEYAHK